jgi:hypothetical protein
MLSKDSIAQIMNAGGNVRIGTLARDSLVELANIAKARNVKLEVRGSMSVDAIVAVVEAGGGNVSWDVSD